VHTHGGNAGPTSAAATWRFLARFFRTTPHLRARRELHSRQLEHWLGKRFPAVGGLPGEIPAGHPGHDPSNFLEISLELVEAADPRPSRM